MTFGAGNITRRRISYVSLAHMLKAMQEDALTIREIAEACGLSTLTVRGYVLTMHREKVCHVTHWEQDTRGRYATAAYALGPDKDAVKPRLGNVERCKRYRKRAEMHKTLQALRLPEPAMTASGLQPKHSV